MRTATHTGTPRLLRSFPTVFWVANVMELFERAAYYGMNSVLAIYLSNSVAEGGLVKVGSRMKATISVDHRVSDGAEAAQFMQALAGFLESPVRMLV